MIGGERATGTLVGGLGARDGLSLEGGKALTYGHGADAARAARVGGEAAVHGPPVVRASHGPVAVSRVVDVADQRGQALGLDDQRGGGAGLVGKPERAGGAALAYEGAGLVTEYKPVQGRRLGEAREVSGKALVGGLGARDGLSLEGGKALTYGHGADAARAARVGGEAAVHGPHVVRASHGPVAASRAVDVAAHRGQAL